MPRRKRKSSTSSSSDSDSTSTCSTCSSSSASSRKSRRNRRKSKKHKTQKRSKNGNEVGVSQTKSVNLHAVAPHQLNISAIIPEFNPLNEDVLHWVEIIEHKARVYNNWSDDNIIFQATSKLMGTALIWYRSLISNDVTWGQYSWKDWREKLIDTFRSRRDLFSLFQDLMTHKPFKGQSLYEFLFVHLAKIENLRLNISELDKISLVLGAIGDQHVKTAVEAAEVKNVNDLASYLRSKTFSVRPALYKKQVQVE
nr:unnamed protein product [Callosobruchus chinensis]